MSVNISRHEGSLEKRIKKLGDMAVEIVNMLATRKVDGETINVADVYFVLTRALEQVSLLNLAEIEEHRRKVSPAKKMVV